MSEISENVVPVPIIPAIPIPPKRKILILSASPKRDLLIDNMLADKLRALGNEVEVKACLREGRQAVLAFQPDIVIVPPIRNPYARDLAETIKKFGARCITRHTEPSCDWDDFKKMNNQEKASILGPIPYVVDAEIVWGPDEAEILQRRGCQFPIYGVGSFSTDKYLTLTEKDCISKEELQKLHKLDPAKKTITILSAWGFADSAPDLQIDEIKDASKDELGRAQWLKMIIDVYDTLKTEYNILVSLHPNVLLEPYEKALTPLGIPIDKDCRSIDLIMNSDIVIHAGSTSGIGAHFLNKVAFQYGDQNKKTGNWWDKSDSMISKVSPYCATTYDLINAIKNCVLGKSNASADTLLALERGRYGLMDGHATDRAAQIVHNMLPSKFNYFWPDGNKDYSQIGIIKSPAAIVDQARCGICNRDIFVVKQSWVDMLQNAFKLPKFKIMGMMACPHCGSRIFGKDE